MSRFLSRNVWGTVLLVVVGLLSSGVVLAEESPEAQSLENLGIEVAIEPRDEPVGTYVLQAEVKDLEKDRLLAAPRLFARRGEEAKASTTLPSGASLEITASLDDEVSAASVHVILVEDGQTVFSQKLTLKIAE